MKKAIVAFCILLGLVACLKDTKKLVGIEKVLPGSPPLIPHDIQGRQKCAACHVGPSSPRELRTSHPERLNCMQCHIYERTKDPFERHH